MLCAIFQMEIHPQFSCRSYEQWKHISKADLNQASGAPYLGAKQNWYKESRHQGVFPVVLPNFKISKRAAKGKDDSHYANIVWTIPVGRRNDF